MIELYDYQESYIEEIKRNFKDGNKHVILCSATGSGKTIMFSYMALEAFKKNKRILILTDRKELFSQSSGALVKFGLKANEIKPNAKVDFNCNLFVAMIQTISRRIQKIEYQELLQSMDLIIIDEAHKTIFDTLFSYVSDKTYVIGATATPLRVGKQLGLDHFYNGLIHVIDTLELIDKGKLSQCKTFGIPIDLKGVKTKGGDYDENSMADKFSELQLYHGVYDNYKRLCDGSKTIIFASNIKSSIELVNIWQLKGMKIKHVDCYMSDTERSDTIDWFENTDGAIISNYGILTTGFDVPTIETVILYRATKSKILFLQMVGRGSRVTDNKNSFTLLDFGNNVKTHDFWQAPREWKLEKREHKEGAAPIKACKECGYHVHASIMTCPECDTPFPITIKPAEKVVLTLLNYKTPVQKLIAIQEKKNYKKSWIYHYLKSKDDFIEYGKIMRYHYKWAEKQFNLRK